EMANVLSTLEAANILASGGSKSVFTTPSSTIATASTCVSPIVATANGSFPTTAVFTTASVATPRVMRSSRGIVIEPSSPISINIPSIRKKDKGKGIMTEPENPSKEKELDMMIAELNRSNEMVAKHLNEYEQAEAELSHDEKVELINELLKYQMDLAQIKKYQAHSASWKAKDFKGMTFDQIEEKFFPVWEKIQDVVPMDSKLEIERLKRPGIQLAQKSLKKLKIAKASVPAEEVYIEALQLLRKFDREDLDKLWSLVKETFSITDPIEDKEKMLWVELKRLYEPDPRDKLWAL
ncbi:hypothetical protein Tco_0397966, partial [Tanacetum coccineum]